MTRNTQKIASLDVPGNDVVTLFSHFGSASQAQAYRELVREDAAVNAAVRWPLLAEIEGLPPLRNSNLSE